MAMSPPRCCFPVTANDVITLLLAAAVLSCSSFPLRSFSKIEYSIPERYLQLRHQARQRRDVRARGDELPMAAAADADDFKISSFDNHFLFDMEDAVVAAAADILLRRIGNESHETRPKVVLD
mmetsp:Transcript_23617/g.42439  ORF Transcript_23617/g.42439 Transcript_23617/m.42439 type:complete len:123 (-) Transcript_23617:325-693(-)